MSKLIFISLLFLLTASFKTSAQQERKHVRQGIRDYHKNEFDNAEVNFRKALDENEGSWEAAFNAGNSLYRLEKHDDAGEMYNKLLKSETDINRKADLFYNIGNSYLSQQKYAESIDAYRNALRNRPEDENARYNLAYAMSMLDEQQNQEGEQDQDQDQDQDQEEDDQDSQPEDGQGQDDRPQPPEEFEGLSREEAERILQAIEDREREVKEEAEKKRERAVAVPLEKDW